jgi:diguanylate cyclase (GGDEF)-like protein/PAS domain S-box-containing protein
LWREAGVGENANVSLPPWGAIKGLGIPLEWRPMGRIAFSNWSPVPMEKWVPNINSVPIEGRGQMASPDDRQLDSSLSVKQPEADAETKRGRLRFDPGMLTYIVCPPALALVLILQRFNFIASHSVWLWLVVFMVVAVVNHLVDIANRRNRNAFCQQLQLATGAATVTTVIYLTGWGPVLIAGYLFGVLEIISVNGPRIWKSAVAWSLLGIVIGQTLIGLSWAPSFLEHGEAQAVAVMGAFIVCFIVRIAAAIAANREVAEASLRASEQSLRRSEQRFRSLVQNSTDTILVVAPDGCIAYASPAAESLLGLPADQLEGREIVSFLDPGDADRAQSELFAQLALAGVTTPIEFKVVGTQDRIRDVEAVVTDLLDEAAVGGWVINMRDITDRTAAEALLVHQAEHDALTGLPNRIVILEQADRIMSLSHGTDKQPSIFFVDLDNFKDVNDSFGHEVGDEVLRVFAMRLSAQLRNGETIGRMGGDEFVILAELTGAEEPVATIATRLCTALAEPIRVMGEDGPLIEITVSIGIAQGMRDSASELLRDADIALYQAKLAGRDRWVLFAPEMKVTALRNLQLRSDLDAAIDNGQFFLLYQPLFDLSRDEMSGVEALIRWNHPTQGVISPDQFIPVLEQTGRIIEVGRWVLDEACRQGALWCSQGRHVGVAVNASARQLEDPDFSEDVIRALTRWGFPPWFLVVEITETSLMHASEMASRHLSNLKEYGVRVAIDDFGTGYSSLSYLLEFSVDALKVDRSFVGAIGTSPHAAAVVRTVMQLGKALNLEVIAEGIENLEQLEFLRAEGCSWGQGFLLSRPIAPSEIENMLDHPRERMQRLAVSRL